MMTNSTHELKTSMVQIYKCTLIIIARRNDQMLQAGKNDYSEPSDENIVMSLVSFKSQMTTYLTNRSDLKPLGPIDPNWVPCYSYLLSAG